MRVATGSDRQLPGIAVAMGLDPGVLSMYSGTVSGCDPHFPGLPVPPQNGLSQRILPSSSGLIRQRHRCTLSMNMGSTEGPLSFDSEAVPLIIDNSQLDLETSSGVSSEWTPWRSSLPYWLLSACTVGIALNTALVALIYTHLNTPLLNRGSPLPRPNQFIGLDTINMSLYHDYSPEPIVNHAPILTQINSASANFVFPDDLRRHFTFVGTVYPEDRHFFVNESTSTVAQFRVLDYAMENCQVVVNIPPRSHLASRTVRHKTFNISPNPVVIEVWRLGADPYQFLDVRALSWKTRPMRVGRSPIANLVVGEDARAASDIFHCQSDSVQTFEFACTSLMCHLDFWQDRFEPLLAAFLMQYPSK